MITARTKVARVTSRGTKPLASAIVVACMSFLAACAGQPVVPAGAAQARAELTRLQSDPQLAPLASQALQDAEAAVKAAEQPERDQEISSHRVFMANRRVEIARALAETRLAENERAALSAQRDKARLDARTREAESAQMKAAALQQEVNDLHARSTDRGLVLTLGDVLFETGRAELKSGTIADLDRLAAFLSKNPDRTVTIEGHTDSVGSEDFNLGLSQRRAEAVRSYLLRQGVDASRISANGLGESAPVASNSTAGGRQQNRRVEIIVGNPPMASSR